MKYKIEDTIVAPATAITNQAIGIIRISGPNSFKIADSIVKNKIDHKKRINIRKIYNKKNDILDECVFLSFFDGKSFTGEEMIEINCHGGVKVIESIIELLISKGCRMAENGEFSKRAFINGKIDLVQSEGINRLINSNSDKSVIINSKIISKNNSDKIIKLKNILVDIISRIQTSIDYPDYDDVENVSSDKVIAELKKFSIKIKTVIEDNKTLLTANNGIKVSLVGKPNVGKSSILNSLSREELAIVTELEGTTRDVVESNIIYKGVMFKFWDTAGIRETNNVIERIGIEKTKEKIKESDIVLWITDSPNEIKILTKNINDRKKEFIILNKCDLKENKLFSSNHIIKFSAKKDPPSILMDLIFEKFNIENIIEKNDCILLSSWEDLNNFKKILNLINNIINELENKQYLDIIIISMYDALSIINNVLGIDNTNEVIDNIFKKYCLGK